MSSGGYVNVDTIELGNDNVYNGTAMSISCSITTAGYETDPEFRFWWSFNGNGIRPTSVSRISTSFYPGTVFPEIYMSLLEINIVSPRDSGVLFLICSVYVYLLFWLFPILVLMF